MWIVRLALRRPYTFIVAAIVIMIMGVLSILRTPKDIFPNINIPVVSVLWGYAGLSPEQMANRLAVLNERALTLAVNDIEHIESESLNGTCCHQDLLSAGSKYFYRPEPSHGYVPDPAPPDAARDHSAAGDSVQRLDRADPPDRAFRAGAFRAAIVRPGRELHPRATGRHRRRGNPLAVRRQATPGAGGLEHRGAAGQGAWRRATW